MRNLASAYSWTRKETTFPKTSTKTITMSWRSLETKRDSRSNQRKRQSTHKLTHVSFWTRAVSHNSRLLKSWKKEEENGSISKFSLWTKHTECTKVNRLWDSSSKWCTNSNFSTCSSNRCNTRRHISSIPMNLNLRRITNSQLKVWRRTTLGRDRLFRRSERSKLIKGLKYFKSFILSKTNSSKSYHRRSTYTSSWSIKCSSHKTYSLSCHRISQKKTRYLATRLGTELATCYTTLSADGNKSFKSLIYPSARLSLGFQ